MLAFATGADVAALLARMSANVNQYSRLVLCSPFIGDEALVTLRNISFRASRTRCDVEIITTPSTLDRALACFDHRLPRTTTMLGSHRLHAKFYLAVARKNAFPEAIVTSSNLTFAGLRSNIELGVHIEPTSTYERELFDKVDQFARQLVNNRSNEWKRH